MKNYATLPVEELHDLNLATLPTEERDFAVGALAGRLTETKVKQSETQVKAMEPGRELTASEERKLEKLAREASAISDAIARAEKYEQEMRRVPIGDNGAPSIQVGAEPSTYRKGDHEVSYFQDLVNRSLYQDGQAAGRLERHRREVLTNSETRALSTAAGVGGEFVPPLHLQNEWIELARAARPFANAAPGQAIPVVGMKFTLPKVTGGGTTAVQATEGGTISTGDPATDDVELNVATIAGFVDMSTQAFERSNPGLDSVVLGDLAADYATKLDVQCLNGSGSDGQVKGILQDSNLNAVTYTSGTATVAEIYPKLAEAVNKVNTNRFMPADAIIMHPRRWAWFLSALDTTDRPLITPVAPSNAAGRFVNVAAENIVGGLMGLPVIIDASVPTDISTNQDAIIVSRTRDLTLFESPAPILRVFEEPLSHTLQVRLRAHGYLAFSSERYSKAHTKVTGSGLTDPFA